MYVLFVTYLVVLAIGLVIGFLAGRRSGARRALWTLARIDVRSKMNAIDSWDNQG